MERDVKRVEGRVIVYGNSVTRAVHAELWVERLTRLTADDVELECRKRSGTLTRLRMRRDDFDRMLAGQRVSRTCGPVTETWRLGDEPPPGGGG